MPFNPGSDTHLNAHRVHQIFRASVLLKGARAAMECAGGIALALVSTSTIAAFVNAFIQHDLTKDPTEFVATHLLAWAQGFSADTRQFYVFYLLSLGIVRLLLVVGLIGKKLWSYPAFLVVLTLFIAYQLYRFTYTHEAGLIVLTMFYVMVMGLVGHEYGLVRRHLPTK